MDKCYLLGAGASVGHNESKPMPLRPPQSWKIFERGRDFGILDADILPDLCNSIQEYVGIDNPIDEISRSNLRFDIEEFLTWLVGEYQLRANDPEMSNEQRYTAHSALGQTFYFLYELLRQYQILYTESNDNYHRLALHYHDTAYSAISLNYDTLFDTALNREGINTHYGFDSNYPPKTVKLAKIHGSINMRVKMAEIALGTQNRISEVSGTIFSNMVRSDRVRFGILPANATSNIKHQDFVRSNSDFDIPAIIPPVGAHKRYQRFEEYQKIHQMARDELRETNKLVIIGCSLRANDVALFDLIDNNLRSDIDMKIVCRSDNSTVADKIRELRPDASIDVSHTEFTEYTHSL